MANSKNTIQNIPLNGELCMNSLKTEVKQFNGFNEKNSTVYGGTLSPIYKKTTELFDKDNSYTVYNSQGVPYTLVYDTSSGSPMVRLYVNNTFKAGVPACLEKTEKLSVPSNTIVAAKMLTFPEGTVDNRTVVYVDSTGWVGGINRLINGLSNVVEAQIWQDITVVDGVTWCGVVVCAIAESGLAKVIYYKRSNQGGWTVYESPTVRTNGTTSPVITGIFPYVSICASGKVSSYEAYKLPVSKDDDGVITFGSWSQDTEHFYRQYPDCINVQEITMHGGNTKRYELQQFACRERVFSTGDFYYNGRSFGRTGHDGDGYIPCPLGAPLLDGVVSPVSVKERRTVFYQNGALLSIGNSGQAIDAVGEYERSLISAYDYSDWGWITYKKVSGDWYCYTYSRINRWSDSVVDFLKKMIIDDRFIIMKNGIAISWVYDIEKGENNNRLTSLDWIISTPPIGSSSSTTGVVFGGGINAGYAQSGEQLVGYLPNPYVMYDCPVDSFLQAVTPGQGSFRFTRLFQLYMSMGNTVQSAEYYGSDSLYKGTFYPIDANGNPIMPISSNAELIKGYSNNDLVKEGSTVYPLMYFDNNTKIYAYQLLAGMYNVTGSFSLQGQQYTVDDENIYMITYNAGVISNVTPVAYKRNLTFLGTLPTQAIFWSDFNKTFYAFTGDRILSKMFEASDINKIKYVGQNPASLSLWICTDTGTYVLSDSDMFKLDEATEKVYFQPDRASMVVPGETKNESHVISLYKVDEDSEKVPVKIQTAYYGLGSEMKAVMDCWYIRLFDADKTEGYVKVKVNTITDVARHTEEKTFKIEPADYDDNHTVYLRYQPKYQECVAMQLELETNLGIYQISLGVNATDAVAQQSKFNF